MKEITTKDGTPFGNKPSLVRALNEQGLTGYDAIEKDGGFIGMKSDKIKCRIHRANCDPDNRDMPISVTVNAASNKKTFWPGEEVELSQAHINVLRDSVEEVRITIPAESGIYASKDPIAVAKNQYPSMKAEVNPINNMITMIRRIPNYVLEIS